VGESYIIGNQNLTYNEFFHYTAEVLKIKPPRLKMPKSLVIMFGRMCSFTSSITGKAPTASYEMTRISCEGNYYSAEKAVKELELPQNDIRIGIKDCFEWFKQNKYIK